MTPAADRPSLLVIDDEPDLRTLYELTLVREGYDVDAAGSVEEAWSLLQQRGYHALITDMRLPDGSGLELLRRLEESQRPERAIVITAYGSAENAVESLKAGAFDYLTKPVDLKQFRQVVAAALGRVAGSGSASRADADGVGQAIRRERTRADGVTGRAASAVAIHRLVGRSPAMQAVRALIEKVARSMAPVLVQGESGTGKELVARAVHEASPRAVQPFVAVNCGAIPENLLEAEFFGYRKGAFTGAAEDRAGFFQAAEGGTLFLDEIGDLPLAMQSKLLRVIQERAVRPVGAVSEVPTQVRIVSATHKDLAAEVAAGRFRQDLFYRLNVIRIDVPALRHRREDLDLLCEALLARIAADAGMAQAPHLSAAALAALALQPLPGNVRELENLLHRAVALCGHDEIGCDDLGLPADATAMATPADGAPAPTAPGQGTGEDSADDTHLPAPRDGAIELPANLEAYLDDIEREVLLRALQKHRYNRTAAGESLGLSLRQMRYRMARLGVMSDKGEPDRGDTP